MAGVIHDITAKREAEARADEGQHRFEKVFHLSPVPTSLTVLADARILDVNEAFHTYFGYSREELLGRTTVEVGIHVDSDFNGRSEEHTSELQSLTNIVCRLLLEKKK